MLALSCAALAVDVAAGRRRVRMPASGWLWIALSLLAVVVTYFGLNPAKGMHRLPKLFWYVGIPVAASLVDSREKAWAVVRAFVLGAGVLALQVLCCNIPAALAVSHEINAASKAYAPLLEAALNRGSISQYAFNGLHYSLPRVSFTAALFDIGDLGDSQRLMAGLVGAAALIVARGAPGASLREAAVEFAGRRLRIPVWQTISALVAAALFLTFKRSSWIAAALVLMPLLLCRIGWKKVLAGAAVAAAIVLAIPAGRARIASLAGEFNARNGGRIVMWTQVAPGVIRDHPWGIGFRAMTPETMRQYSRIVERDREHLHSNPIEMTSSLGWLGLAIYLLWVFATLRDSSRLDNGVPPESRGLSLAVGGMLATLYLNGLVEYNFADAEIVLLYGILAGTAASSARRRNLDSHNH